MATEIQPKASSPFDRFQKALVNMVEQGASDLHISAGIGFRTRVKGTLITPSDSMQLSPNDCSIITAGILLASNRATRENVGQITAAITDLDCSYTVPALGRFRVNVAMQRQSLSITLRHIPHDLPTIESLGLPKVLVDVAMAERGLVLLTGITGSGKSSTLAAMINYVNHHKHAKVVTIEDPIEFVYKGDKSFIIQRECGSDTQDFAKALRAALRQDPDIILVGEMRDRETIDIAIKAAETGHLVFSTVHTTDAPKTISRLVSVFEPLEQTSVRARLSETLQAVISQRLLRKADGSGRVVACEIMRKTKSIEECIENPAKTDQMKDFIEKGREIYGMQTFDQHLTELFKAKLIDLETAKSAATSPADFERALHFQ